MKSKAWPRLAVTGLVVAGFILALICPAMAQGAGQTRQGIYTPTPGSAARRAILDAIRRDVDALKGMKLVFKVDHLKVGGAWAWAVVSPRSKDGKSRYESFAALLQYHQGQWRVKDTPPLFDPDGVLSEAQLMERFRKRFPQAPAGIYEP